MLKGWCSIAGTPFETGHRTWFYFGVTGFAKGDILHFTVSRMRRSCSKELKTRAVKSVLLLSVSR